MIILEKLKIENDRHPERGVAELKDLLRTVNKHLLINALQMFRLTSFAQHDDSSFLFQFSSFNFSSI